MSIFPFNLFETSTPHVDTAGGVANVWQASDATLTRPANTTAYASGGAIGSNLSAIFKFTGVFRQVSNTGLLTGLRLVASGASIATTNMGAITGHLFNASPSGAGGFFYDQLQFPTLLADDALKLGTVSFSTWNVGGTGSNLIESYGSPAIQPLPMYAAAAAKDLYLVLVASAAFTPLSAQVIQPYVSIVLD